MPLSRFLYQSGGGRRRRAPIELRGEEPFGASSSTISLVLLIKGSPGDKACTPRLASVQHIPSIFLDAWHMPWHIWRCHGISLSIFPSIFLMPRTYSIGHVPV